MDVHFQIVQSIILGITKEESMGLHSNGTKGTEQEEPKNVLFRPEAKIQSDGVKRLPQAIFFPLKE